jgi:CxxC motif-containing protein
MNERKMVCISCPLGCRLTVRWREEPGAEGADADGSAVRVEGNRCAKGEQYAREEILAPKRVVTATVRIRAGRTVRLPVKTSAPLAKEEIPALLDRIYAWELAPPILLGQRLLEDIAGTGVDLVATRSVRQEV